MPPKRNEEELMTNLECVSRSTEDVSLDVLDDNEEPSTILQEFLPLLQLLERALGEKEAYRVVKAAQGNKDDFPTLNFPLEPAPGLDGLASARGCSEQAAGVLHEIQALMASEIQTWERHRASCTTLEQAGVARAEECIELEKEILQEYEKLQRQVESSFQGIRVKTEGKLLSPYEKQMAELLEKNRELETRLKDTEEQKGNLNDELTRTTGELAKTKDELAKVKEDLEGKKTEIIVPEKELGVANDFRDNDIAFGASAWNKYFGNVGQEPPLPENIADLLESPCPFWNGKKIRETHLLVLIPSTVNGHPFSLDLLGILIQNPIIGRNKMVSWTFDVSVKFGIGRVTVKRSYWILITRDIVPDSKNTTYEEAVAASFIPSRTCMDYKCPGALEVTTAMLANYARSGKILVDTGVWARCNDSIAGLGGGSYRPLVGPGFFYCTAGIQVAHDSTVGVKETGVLACCCWKQL